MTTEEERELCLNCRHTKRFHSKGSCSQPTCMCNCFIESGLIYTTDIFNSFEQGKSQATKEILEKSKIDGIIGELLIKEKYKFIQSGLIGEIIRDFIEQLKKLGEEGS